MAPTNSPAPFASIRSSKDYGLVAFAGALFAAFALHAGAFLPTIGGADGRGSAPVLAAARQAATPTVVAHRPATSRTSPTAAQAEPCPSPRG